MVQPGLGRAAWRAVADTLPAMLFTVRSDGRLELVNRYWAESTGRDPKAADAAWPDFVHRDDLARLEEVPKRFRSFVGQPMPRGGSTGTTNGITNTPVSRPTKRWAGVGKPRSIRTRAEPQRDRNGKIVRWYGSYVDIDAQKEAMERTKRIAATLQDVFLPKVLPTGRDRKASCDGCFQRELRRYLGSPLGREPQATSPSSLRARRAEAYRLNLSLRAREKKASSRRISVRSHS